MISAWFTKLFSRSAAPQKLPSFKVILVHQHSGLSAEKIGTLKEALKHQIEMFMLAEQTRLEATEESASLYQWPHRQQA